MAWVWFHKFGSPPHFYRIAGRLIPWMAWPALILGLVGTVWGLVFSPTDYQQGEGYRIISVHVPSAVLSMLVYGVMATAAAVGLVWRMTVGFAVANACTVIGASFTALALATGSLWGRPMWGTWWVWDPRVTSELLLLFLSGLLFFVAIMLMRARGELLLRERQASWLLEALAKDLP